MLRLLLIAEVVDWRLVFLEESITVECVVIKIHIYVTRSPMCADIMYVYYVGDVFCSNCSSFKVLLSYIDPVNPVKVCIDCRGSVTYAPTVEEGRDV